MFSVGRTFLKILLYIQFSVYGFIRMYLTLYNISLKSLFWFRIDFKCWYFLFVRQNTSDIFIRYISLSLFYVIVRIPKRCCNHKFKKVFHFSISYICLNINERLLMDQIIMFKIFVYINLSRTSDKFSDTT